MPRKRAPEYFKGTRLKVGVIGCGYVGLPLGLRLAEAGHVVVGFDTDHSKVEKLNRGQTYIGHIPGTKIQQYVNSKHFSATDDFTQLGEMDAVLICVPTPLDQRRQPDLSYVEQTARAIQPNRSRGMDRTRSRDRVRRHAIDSCSAKVIAVWSVGSRRAAFTVKMVAYSVDRSELICCRPE